MKDKITTFFDDKTKVLTEKEGWQLIKDVKIGDYIATIKYGKFMYDTIKDIQQGRFDGNMVHYTNEESDLLVAPKQPFYTKTQAGIYRLVSAEYLMEHPNLHAIPPSPNETEHKRFINTARKELFLKYKPYNGIVYHITVESHVLLAKREKGAIWCGC